MIDGPSLVKYVHILLAIVAVGLNASYGVWIGRASRDSRHLGFALRGVKFLDDYVANPCYIALLATGALMVWLRWSWTQLWIELAVGLWVVAMVMAYGFYTPTLRRQIDALDRRGAASPEYKALAMRGTILGIALGVIVLTIVFLMVTKPTI